MKTVKTICLVFVIVLTLSGCDTGGSDSSNKNAPRITDAELYRWNGVQWVQTSEFYMGDYVNCRVCVHDADMDIRYMYVLQYYPDDAMVPYFLVMTFYYSKIRKPDVCLTLSDPVVIGGGPAGAWRVEAQFEDARGNLSNVWTEYTYTYY